MNSNTKGIGFVLRDDICLKIERLKFKVQRLLDVEALLRIDEGLDNGLNWHGVRSTGRTMLMVVNFKRMGELET